MHSLICTAEKNQRGSFLDCDIYEGVIPQQQVLCCLCSVTITMIDMLLTSYRREPGASLILVVNPTNRI